ncbi:MAG: hypothetical protein K0U72_01470 [Gammaproteobacteria bacterium]|nr:hypothetical protein [Gammaproteobacteria bacterium]
MRRFFAILLLLICPLALAEDGLTIQLIITEQADGSDRKQSYTNAILMRLNEEVSFDFADKYVFKVASRQVSSTKVSLVVTLKDVIDGKPYYVGAHPVDLEIGDQTEFRLQNYETSYTLNLDTSFGKIPE